MSLSQVDIAVNKALSLKGSHAYDDYCQRFVRICFEAAGIRGEAASANEACEKWMVSDNADIIPRGAAVYFKGFGSDGHVGIATGSGNLIHAANGVRVMDLALCCKKYTFKGWGWQGGVRPSGAAVDEAALKASEKSVKTKKSKKAAAKLRPIEEISKKSLGGEYRDRIFGAIDSAGEAERGYELLIENDRVYLPVISGELSLVQRRSLSPGRLRFKVLKDNNIDFGEGSPVRLRIGGRDVFRGYVFEKSREERDIIAVTAYDSLRYFKNRDTVLYRGKKYSDLLKMLIKDYRLKEGDICDTGYVIEKQLEEGTIFDILANAADITYTATGRSFVLLDDFGKICLRNTEAMTTELVFDKDNIGSFDYTSTIDREVYDYVQLLCDDKTQGVRNVYSVSDENTALWGRLQLSLKPKEELTAAQLKAMGDEYLKRYSRKRRYLTLNNVKGNIAVRGGSVVTVALDLGDIVINERMTCESVTHRLWGKSHLMDIELYGREGEFDV